MTDDHRLPAAQHGDSCASSLAAAESICDPVDRLLALSEIAHRAAAAVRDVDAATSRAVSRALTTMSLDDLSDRLHRSSGDILFLTASFVTPTPEVAAPGSRSGDPTTPAPVV